MGCFNNSAVLDTIVISYSYYLCLTNQIKDILFIGESALNDVAAALCDHMSS